MYGAEIAGGQIGADWSGDHTFSQSAVSFGLHEYIEPDVVLKNPHLTPTEAHNEASRILSLRLMQDQLFDQKETHREDTMVTKWTIADIDGEKQLVTRYGEGHVSLRELWRHTEEFALRVGKPEAFDRAEMQTQIAIQDALINGRVTEAMFTLSHPESVRYVQQWQQGMDGIFYSTQIDIGKFAGRDLRHDEVKSFLDRFRDKYRDRAIHVDGAVAGSYVAVRGKIDTMTIVTTAKHVNGGADGDIFNRNRFLALDQPPRENKYASDRAYPLWVIRDRRWFNNKKDGDTEIQDAHEVRDVSRQPEVSHKPEIHPIKAKRYVFKDTVSGAKFLRKEYESRRRVLHPLRIIAETRTMVHAVPVILSSLVEKLLVPVQAMEKSIKRHKKKEVRKINHEFRKSKLKKRSEIETSQLSRKERKKRKKRAKLYIEMPIGSRINTLHERGGRKDRTRRRGGIKEKMVNKSAVVDRLTIFTLKKEKQLNKRRLRRVAKRERKLWRLWRAVEKSVRRYKKREIRIKNKELRGIAKREVKKDSVKVQPLRSERVEPLKERMQSIQRKEREAVIAIRFAWVVWMLLKTKNESKQILDPRFRGDDRRRVGNDKESVTPWILLSVIWYLAMAREAGLVTQAIQATRARQATQTTKKKNKKKQTYKKHLFFPKHAVIFAFNS